MKKTNSQTLPRFSTAILRLVLLLLTVTSVILLAPAYIGSQQALQQEMQLAHNRDQRTLLNLMAEQFDNIYRTSLELVETGPIQQALLSSDRRALNQVTEALLASPRGQRIDAIVIEPSSADALTIRNSSLLNVELPLLELSQDYQPYTAWHSIATEQSGRKYLLLRLTLPVIEPERGRVIGKIHSYVMINDNYWLMNTLQELFGSKALSFHYQNRMLAGIEDNPGQLSLLSTVTIPTDGIVTLENSLIRQHLIKIGRSQTFAIRLLFPNSAFINLRDSYLTTLFFSALLVLFLGIATMLVLRRMVRNSLKQLTEYAEQIPESGSPHPFTGGRFHEFVRVGKAVELMLMRVRERDKRLASIVDNSPDLIFIKDLQQRYRLVNKRFSDILDLPPERMIGSKDDEILSSKSMPMVHSSDKQVLEQHSPAQYEINLTNPKGDNLTFLMSKFPIFDDLGRAYAIGGIATDITEIKQTQRQLSLAHQVFAETAEAILVLDKEHNIVRANKAFSDITGYPEDLVTRAIDQFLSAYPEIVAVLKTDNGRWQGECTLKHSHGHDVPVLVSATPLADSTEAKHVILFTNISKLKSAEQRLEQMALYDSLTGLPNRTLFYQRLEEVFAYTDNSHHSAIMFIDLDRFKGINDTYGHNVGDQLLQQVAIRLQSCVKSRDTVCRLGGDEFTLIIRDSRSLDKIESIAHRILASLREPYQLGDIRCFTSGSIGIALPGQDGDDSYTLTRHADLAMYQAKESGRNNIQFFDQTINQKNLERHKLEKGLREALHQNQLFLHYQPRFDIQGNRVLSTEALLRWNFGEQGLISPAVFIPIAEDSGFIIEIGRFVLKQACEDAARWLEQGIEVPVSVNLSPRQLTDESLLDDLELALSQSNLPAEMLELEITETHVMENIDQVIPILYQIRAMGISLSIDDFGTGYSSLMYLKKLPVNTIKIDRSFVMDVPGNEDDEALIQAIIRMSHSLRLNVVAEGVETTAQQEFLQSMECDELQGFLLGKPDCVETLIDTCQQPTPA